MATSAAALVACAAVLAGCGSSDGDVDASSSSGDEDAVITMSGDAFDPETTTVKVGDTVSFENKDDHDHNVRSTSGDSKIDIDDFDSGSKSATLDKAGTVDFECTIHGGMTGSIKVEDA